MLLDESYLNRFEKNAGLKKGVLTENFFSSAPKAPVEQAGQTLPDVPSAEQAMQTVQSAMPFLQAGFQPTPPDAPHPDYLKLEFIKSQSEGMSIHVAVMFSNQTKDGATAETPLVIRVNVFPHFRGSYAGVDITSFPNGDKFAPISALPQIAQAAETTVKQILSKYPN